MLASDRRLTAGMGSSKGQLIDDDTCKLVNLCNIWGIGYSGSAHLEHIPTHEWIAIKLAESNCGSSELAGKVLTDKANDALRRLPLELRRQVFIITGWNYFVNHSGMRPFVCIITNFLDDSYRPMLTARDSLDCRVHELPKDEGMRLLVIGQPLRLERGERLERNLRRLVNREIGPREALRLLSDEIIHTAVLDNNATVGSKILGLCIPLKAVERQLQTGDSAMLAKSPDQESVTFTYFDSGYDELQQHGPTFVCGDFAATDIETENDPSRDFQSAQCRILRGASKLR